MKKIVLGSLILLASAARTDGAEINNMRCEYITSPMGVDVRYPRLSWEFGGDKDETSSVRVELHDAAGRLVWRHDTTATNRITYTGPQLLPRTSYTWTVAALDRNGHRKASATAKFETGITSTDDWKGTWISDGGGADICEAPVFTKDFTIDSPVKTGRVYVSAAGYYEMTINGHRVGNQRIDPGYTAYDKRSLYAVHDVTPLLKKGRNSISVTLGNGFANLQSRDAWGYEKAPWRDRPQFICEVWCGGVPVAVSDTTWTASTGPIRYNNLYSGVHRDNTATITATGRAVEKSAKAGALQWQSMPPVRETSRIHASLVKEQGDTLFVYDLGKNIAGVCDITLKGARDTRVRVSHGELLKDDGRLEQGNLAIYYHPLKEDEAFQTDEFILAGEKGGENFMPDFTYHGFRYVEVRSDKPVKISKLDGVQLRTDIPRIGQFRCSDSLLNRIYDAAMLSYEGSIHSIPTDCPQREKNGWTADAHVAIDLALLNYDGITLYEKWMRDHMDNQLDNGNISGIIPSGGWGYGDSPGPVWDAGLFIIPLALYDYYGDMNTMRDLYPHMLRYMSWIESLEREDGTLGCGIGDWLPYSTTTPTDFTSTLYHYADCRMMARICRLLGKKEEATIYDRKAEQKRDIINNKYYDPEKKLYANGSQAAQGIALYWDLPPEGDAQAVAANLNRMVEANGYALDFGLLGSKSVLRMLTRYGYPQTAFRMATRTEAPGWGYWVEKCGQTTLAETWVMSPEFRDASLNHVFFGDIAAWMTNDIAGLNFDPEAPGFKNVIIRPTFMDGLDFAEASYHSVNGPVRCAWHREGSAIHLDVEIPEGTTATVILPDGRKESTDRSKRYII